MATKSFKDLIVWQKAKELIIEIYKITACLPSSERYGLSSQMKRAALSIASNIAEGYNRQHEKDKRFFNIMAYGSGSELESDIAIAKILFPKLEYKRAENLLTEVSKILNTFINKNRN